uniref:Uncharacterized protein n=1 Tax=Anguilla anguilla TaxID=7936 RepID=A0A0E9QYB4_ANGAN
MEYIYSNVLHLGLCCIACVKILQLIFFFFC